MSATLRVSLMVLFAVGATSSDAAAARAKISISAPTSVAGDGKTTLEVVVSIVPASEVANISNVDVRASSGTLSAPKPRGDSTIVYQFTPPRVAAAVTTTLEVTATHGRRRLRARHAIQISGFVGPVGQQKSGGSLDLIGPARLVLGTHQQAELSTAGDVAPRLSTNSGTISVPTRGADGRWRATYTPPSSFAPHIAIVAATRDSDSALDWFTIPLHGKGKLNVVSEAGAVIQLDVGDTRFGPIRAGRSGTAAIPITVPPGLVSATSIVRDGLGNTNRSTLPLKPPPFGRIHAVCPGVSGPIRALVIESDGRRADAASITGTANVGELSPFTKASAGVFESSLTLDEAAHEQLAIELGLDQAPISTSKCRGNVPRERPLRLAITPARKLSRAGGEPIEVSVELSYRANAKPLAWPIKIESSTGTVSDVEEVSVSQYKARWTPPKKLVGKSKATITATLVDLPVAPATATVELRPAKAATIEVDRPARTRADGHSRGLASIRVADPYGNPTTVDRPVLRVGGRDFPLEPAGDGRYRGSFSLPRSTSTTGVIAADVSGGDGLSTTVMLPFRGVRPKLSVALRGGYFSNFDRVAGPTAAVALDYHLPFAGGERFAVGVDLGLSMSTTNETMPESLTIETRSLPILARASVWHPVSMVWLYAGANFGPVVSELAVESASTGRVATTEWTLALGAFAGADVGLGPGRLIFEAGYTRANVDSTMVEGNVLGLQISAGYRLGLF